MKAKIKATGKILDVFVHGTDADGNVIAYHEPDGFPCYKPEELDFDVSDRADKYISLNKACEWLKKNTYSVFTKSCSLFDAVEEFTENFKQAMKGGDE